MFIEGWPDYFEVDQVPKLLKAELKPRPRLKNFSSVGTMLQECNIRDQLDRKMLEFEQSPAHERARSASAGPSRDNSMGGPQNNSSEQHISLIDRESEQMQSEQFEVLSQHGISKDTFDLITTKEKLEEDAKQRNKETMEKMTHRREL